MKTTQTERGPDEMVNTTIKRKKSWIQVVGLVILAFLLAISMIPEKTHAFSLFNKSGNDGYFLSLTNDPGNVRVVPVTIYDQHHKAQKTTKFIEWVDVKVNYRKYPMKEPLPKVDGGEDGRTGWVDKLEDIESDIRDIGKHSILTWTFPGFGGVVDAEDYNATQTDLDRAQWVSDTLVHDFNGAISMVHGAVQEYGNGDLDNMSPNQFANMIRIIANAGYTASKGGTGKINYHGVTFEVKKDTKVKPVTGVSKNAYVTLKLVDAKKDFPSNLKKTFIQYVPKGYRDGQALHNSLGETFKEIVEEKKDPKTLNWKMIVLQSNSNWSANNVTYTNVGSITSMNKLEQAVTDALSNTLTWLRETLGLYSASDLIMNGGTRGTDTYYKGIMPKIWMDSAAILHWISYALAWMLIIGAIVKLLVQRNLAAINPSERVDMINGIKNLMIVGFALSIFDVAFASLAEMNHMIVNLLANSSSGVTNFGSPPVSSGMLASIIVGLVFFCLDVYFNFFYIARALMVAILYAVGPLYVAAIAFGEKYRQIFGNYVKEMIGNIFVQSFQAILVVFFVGLSIMGNLRTIETLVLLFCFIPMTRFFKESIGASSSASDAMTSTALGATTGAMAGVISSQFLKRRNNNKGGGRDNQAVEGGSDIRQKSGSSFAVGGGKRQTAGSMIGHGLMGAAKTGLKGAGAAALGTVGTGLVAGGAATGIHGASQLGGLAIGGAFNQGRDIAGAAAKGAKTVGAKAGKATGKTAVAGVNKLVDYSAANGGVAGHGIASARDWGRNTIARFNPNNIAMKNHGIGEETPGSPMPEEVTTLADGSAMQTFDKSKFFSKTGISSMRDIDNNGMEMEIGTTYVDGDGFINGVSTGLTGSQYEKDMGTMIESFKSKDKAKIARYQEQGIMGMRIDRDSGRVSFRVDKDRAGIGEVYNAGDNIQIQRKKTYGQPRSDEYATGHANPFSHI